METLIDMIPFLTVLLAMVYMFALVDMIIYKQQLRQTNRTFSESLIVTYQIMFGENPPVEDLMSIQPQIYLYVSVTLLLNVMTLNLLISIISNTYERLQSVQKSTDLKQKAEMLMEVEVIMLLKRKSGKPLYLHVMRYADDAEGDGEGVEVNSDRWEGRLRLITNKTDRVLSLVRSHGQRVEEIEVNLNERITNVEKKISKDIRDLKTILSEIRDQLKDKEPESQPQLI